MVMTILALIHNENILNSVRSGGWFDLPDGSRASPAHDGWTDGIYSLKAILPAEQIPSGKYVISTSVELINGLPQYVNVLDDIPPEPLLPLTSRQLRLGLITNGIPLSSVEGAIASISDSQDRAIAEIEWEYASQFERGHPLISQVGIALGLAPEEIDNMWQEALSL